MFRYRTARFVQAPSEVRPVRSMISKLKGAVAATVDSDSRARRLGPFLLLGPLTGPLVAGVVLNLRRGNRVLASMYAYLLVYGTFGLPAQLIAWSADLAVG